MPKCTSCNNQWSWKETLKSSFTLDTGMICPYCGSKQFQTKKSRKQTTGLSFVGLFPLALTAFLDLSAYSLVGLYLIILTTLVVFIPRLIILTGEEEQWPY